MGMTRHAYRILVGNSEGKTPVGIPKRLCENNNKMDLIGIGWEAVD
jgi:hypothetical protein